jgi:hypothetical protein
VKHTTNPSDIPETGAIRPFRGVTAVREDTRQASTRRTCSCLNKHSATQLSPARQALVCLLHDISFGRLEDLSVRCGEPILQPPPRVIRTVRFGASEDAGTTPSVQTLAQRPAILRLMSMLSRMQNGCIARLEIRNAQPAFMEIVIGTSEGAVND